jgi:hypothetical protein
MRRKPIVTIAAGAGLLAGVFAGTSSLMTDDFTSATTERQVSGIELTVLDVDDPLDPTGAYASVGPGFRRVGISVDIYNGTDDTVAMVALADLVLHDDTDARYRPYSGGDAANLPGGIIPAGGTNQGIVTFQLPESASPVSLSLAGAAGAASANLELE